MNCTKGRKGKLSGVSKGCNGGKRKRKGARLRMAKGRGVTEEEKNEGQEVENKYE